MPVDHPLSPGTATLAVLDANVLLPPRLSDLLFDLFLEGLYQPRRTQSIEDEFIKNYGHVVLAKGKAQRKLVKSGLPDPLHTDKARRRLASFRAAVGAVCEVHLYDTPVYRSRVPAKVDVADIHVAAAALVLHHYSQHEDGADKVFIVTNNLALLAVEAMAALGIRVVSPGTFINLLNQAAPGRVEKALLRTTDDLNAPAFGKGDLLALLMVHGAAATAEFHAARWKVTIPQRRTTG